MSEQRLKDQIERLRRDIAQRESAAVRLETEVVELEREVGEFKATYERIVGRVAARVQAARAALDELKAARTVTGHNDTPYQTTFSSEPLRHQPRGNPRARPPAGPPPPPRPYTFDGSRAGVRVPRDGESPFPAAPDAAPPETLRQVYHRLARRYHPDLADDPAERQRRTELMKRINAAYAAGDVNALRLLDSGADAAFSAGTAFGASGAAAQTGGDPLLLLTYRQLQEQAVDLDIRLADLRARRSDALYGEWMKLKVDEKLARRKGRDLLADIAAQLEQEYAACLREMDALRGA